MTNKPTPIGPLLEIEAVGYALSRSRSSIYRDIKAKNFPKQLKIHGSACWRTSQVRNFIDALCPAES